MAAKAQNYIGRLIRSRRTSLAMTQTQLAEKLGWCRVSRKDGYIRIHKIEHGRLPRANVLDHIFGVLESFERKRRMRYGLMNENKPSFFTPGKRNYDNRLTVDNAVHLVMMQLKPEWLEDAGNSRMWAICGPFDKLGEHVDMDRLIMKTVLPITGDPPRGDDKFELFLRLIREEIERRMCFVPEECFAIT